MKRCTGKPFAKCPTIKIQGSRKCRLFLGRFVFSLPKAGHRSWTQMFLALWIYAELHECKAYRTHRIPISGFRLQVLLRIARMHAAV
ncbi:hypothetical protein K469DRAFT_703325, partial [Zopfia rhizophila CBS 207.26]